MMQRETNCMPAPITSAILRRVLCELPIGTSRAVESCVNSYKKRFMSSQDIIEFLRSIATQSETLKSVFREHDRANGKFDSEPAAWEEEGQTSASPVGTGTSSVREPAGPPAGHMVESPTALLHGPIPSVTDHTAWSVPDGGSGVPLELLFQQEQEYATWAGQPRLNFSDATIAHHRAAAAAAAGAAAASREARRSPIRQASQEWTASSPRTLQRSSSPVLQRSSSPPVLQRSSSPKLQRSSSPKKPFSMPMAMQESAVSPQSKPAPKPRVPTPKETRAPKETRVQQHQPQEASLPLELLWEQEHWSCRNPVPSPEDLVSGNSSSSTPSRTEKQSESSSSGEPGGASAHQEESLGVPFELLWEQEQFQRSHFEYHPVQYHQHQDQHDHHQHQDQHDHHDHHEHHHDRHEHHDQSHHDHHHQSHHHHHHHEEHHYHVAEHHDHRDHRDHHEHHEQHHHEPGGLMQEEEECRPVAPTGVPLELLWQHGHEPGTPVPHPEDLVSGPPAPRKPEEPNLPLELIWQTKEWRHSDYHPIEHPVEQPTHTSAFHAPRPKAAAAPPAPTVHHPPAADAEPPSLPLELMFQHEPMFQQCPQPPIAAPSSDSFAAPAAKKARTQNKLIREESTASNISTMTSMTWESKGDDDRLSEEDLDEEEDAVGEEEEVAGEEEAKPAKPKRKRIRTVKPSAPPSEEDKLQMARYANRRRDEIDRRRKEAGRAAVRMPPVAPVKKGKKKGADAIVKWEPLPAGSEDKPAGILRYTILELSQQLDRDGKIALKNALAAFTDGRKNHDELAAEIQTLVDAHQISIPLPLPMRGPFRMTHPPHPHCPSKFGHPHPHPHLPMHGRPGAFFPPPFPGMHGFHHPMMGPGPMGMHFPPGMDMSMLMPMPKAGKSSGGGRRRKRKRGSDRDANARCPVCVDGPLQDERWVKCDGCSTWYHQVCVLYNELANGRKLRFFCRTPNCQKRNSRQLNRRYRKARHPMSPLLPETQLSVEMAQRAASMSRTDRKVVVKEVFAMPLEECVLGDASPKDAEGKCECCTRRTMAAFQHTVTGSDLLFMVLFVDEHLPKNGAKGRAVVQEFAVNGLYEEASEGESLRVEAAMVEAYLRDLARRGIERVEVAEPGEGGDKSLISSSDPAECARRAKDAWVKGAEAAQKDGVATEVSEALVRLNVEERKVLEDGAAMPSKVDCKMMETAAKLRSFLSSRQYGFTTLQTSKYASMMLVYHLDQAMTASVAAPDAAKEEEEDDEEEDLEDIGEEAQNADQEHEMEGGCGGHHHADHHFDGGFHAGVDAWRKEVGSGSFRGHVDNNTLYSQPYMFPFLEADH